MPEYKNIPVDPETYQKVKQLAKANRRGLGAQVAVMVESEEKRAVEQQPQSAGNDGEKEQVRA